MPSGSSPRSAMEIELNKLSSPRIFLVRMLVFVVLGGLVAVLLHKQIEVAFMANPGLNSVIIFVLLIGIVLAFRQVIRLYPEIAWVNNFRLADPGPRGRPAAGAAGADGGDPRRPRIGRMAMSAQLMRGISRFDRHPPRRGARHLPLHDRPSGVPRPARHLLGPDRDRRLGRRA